MIAAALCDKAHCKIAVDSRKVTWQNFIRHNNAGLCENKPLAVSAVKDIYNAGKCITDIACTLRKVFITYIFHSFAVFVHSKLNRPCSTHMLLYLSDYKVCKAFIVQHNYLKVQYIVMFSGGVLHEGFYLVLGKNHSRIEQGFFTVRCENHPLEACNTPVYNFDFCHCETAGRRCAYISDHIYLPRFALSAATFAAKAAIRFKL